MPAAPQNTPDSGGDSHINDMDYILGDTEDVEQSAEPADGGDVADSGEPPAEAEPESTTPEGTTADPKEERILALAKEHGLDPTAHRKALELLVLQEKRIADKDDYIGTLSQADAWLTDFEKSLTKGQPDAAAQTKKEEAPAPRQPQPFSPSGPIRLGDVGDAWNTPADAAKDLYEAFSDQNTAKAAQIQEAWFSRQMMGTMPHLLQYMQEMVQGHINQFREKEFGEVRQTVEQAKQARMRDSAYDAAVSDLTAKPALKQLWDEMNKATGEFEFNGQTWADKPLNRILAEYPEILKIRVEDPNPEKAWRLTAIEQYRAAMRIYAKQKSSTLTPKKAEALVTAGTEQAKREAGKERARQKLNASGARGQAPLSDDDKWLDDLAKSRGSQSGASVQTLFS